MSRTSVKSRLLLRSPTCITGSCSPFSIMAICLAKDESTKFSPLRGPLWLKPRDTMALVILVREHFLGDLADGVWGQGPQRVGLLHGHLVREDQTVLFRGACYLDQ